MKRSTKRVTLTSEGVTASKLKAMKAIKTLIAIVLISLLTSACKKDDVQPRKIKMPKDKMIMNPNTKLNNVNFNNCY